MGGADYTGKGEKAAARGSRTSSQVCPWSLRYQRPHEWKGTACVHASISCMYEYTIKNIHSLINFQTKFSLTIIQYQVSNYCQVACACYIHMCVYYMNKGGTCACFNTWMSFNTYCIVYSLRLRRCSLMTMVKTWPV